ncbi:MULTISPECIES: hypothetical protein [Methylomonas]|uniref:Uncharacterized protein n=1 Tax=Methylomonas methanica TaxID=421 RepID=A0ABY2CL99_METMH|nr:MULTISPECIES: hypothetical protein [Methylomonas]TCV83176.1 hypothetical protein EDE11_110135 [Methylomonas methanica]
MKKPTQIASLLFALITALISTSVFADTDNCSSFFPKVPYSCVLVRVQSLPSERAEFSAFETGTSTSKASVGNVKYTLRSVSRDTARKLRSQNTGVAN